MLKITTAKGGHLPIISVLANQIWRHTYQCILTQHQITFMLNDMYSLVSLQNQLAKKHIFKMLTFNNKPFGFASYSKINDLGVYKIQKLYVHQNYQGQGFGKSLLTAIECEVKKLGATAIHLNVSRENKALFFYQKMGYKILKQVDISYHIRASKPYVPIPH